MSRTEIWNWFSSITLCNEWRSAWNRVASDALTLFNNQSSFVFKCVSPGKQSCGKATRSRSLGTLTFSVVSSLGFPAFISGLSLFFLMKKHCCWVWLKFLWAGSLRLSLDTNGGAWTCRTSGSSSGRGLPFTCSKDWTQCIVTATDMIGDLIWWECKYKFKPFLKMEQNKKQ